MAAMLLLLGVFGVWGRGGVGLTLETAPDGALGVNSLAEGFKENSLALGFRVDFLTLSVAAAGDAGDAAAPVSGAGGDRSGAGAVSG